MKNPIVILHGWGLSGSKFSPLVKSLQKVGYDAYAPDLPGFGRSEFPKKPLVLDDYAEFLRVFLEEKRMRKAVLIGHSFGGRVAIKFSSRYAEEVVAVVLTGTPGFTPIPRGKLLVFIALAKIGGFVFSLPVLGILKDTVRRLYYYLVGAREFYRAEGVMRQTFKNIVQEELEVPMKQMGVPVLLLWGAEDPIVPANIAHMMKNTIQESKLVIEPAADHGFPFNSSSIFSQRVSAFLQELKT